MPEKPDRGTHRGEPLMDHVKHKLDEAAAAEEDHEKQERNAGVAIAVLALLIVLLFVAIITGATDAYQP